MWDDPKKEEIMEAMPDFTAWGLAGRDDHGPRADAGKARKAKPPSSSDEGEAVSESSEESGEEVGRHSSGSEEEETRHQSQRDCCRC